MSSWSHIELSAGTVTASTIEDAEGVRALPDEIGKFMFFVDAVEVDGGRLSLDSTDDYETAIRLAEAARNDLEIDFPVRDNGVGSH